METSAKSTQKTNSMKKTSNIITMLIIICMVLGVIVGYALHSGLEQHAAAEVADNFSIVSTMFLRLIKMVIAPLIFSTLVVGIAHMGDGKTIGRVGLKAMLWFVSASFVSLFIGLIVANVLQPGVGLNMALPATDASTGLQASGFTARHFFINLIPSSLFKALSDNEILQIVVFSILFGVALASLGKIGKKLLAACDELAHVMLKLTGMIMWAAPAAVFAAMTATIAKQGLGVIGTLAKFMGSFYVGIAILWAALILVGFSILGPRIFKLMREVREAFLLSFATASSEAAFPKILTGLDRFGVKRRVSSFVMPLGYSFNLDGSMMYCTFASLFVAQAYGIELDMGTQITMMMILMLTSKGMAGVPRASLVVIAANLNHFGIPEAGLLLILGVDTFLDMARSATNAIGNSLASAVVAKWEGDLLSEEEAAENALLLDAEEHASIGHNLDEEILENPL